jgi:hypothetical protein
MRSLRKTRPLAQPPNKTYFEVKTLDYHVTGVQKPIVYIIDHTRVEVVWQEPDSPNGRLIEYNIFRNNELVATLNLDDDDSNITNSSQSRFTYKLGFFIFRDEHLVSDGLYTYKVQASNEHYSRLSAAVNVQMPPTTFLIDCSSESPKRPNTNSSHIQAVQRFNENTARTDEATLSLFNGVLRVNFTVISSSQIRIAYDFAEWKRFILCLSKSSYSSSSVNKSALDVVSVFSIKILLHSNLNGLQSLDFPYPSKDDTDLAVNKVQFMLSGLIGFSNYSIRISLSALYPNTQVNNFFKYSGQHLGQQFLKDLTGFNVKSLNFFR